MNIEDTFISDVKIISPKKHEDERGFFLETYNEKILSDNNINLKFIQDNHSFSRKKGVLRGLHYQTSPFAQDKLVRVVSGSIFDVAVDLRKNSNTFGKYVSKVITAKNWLQMLIPVGFAHGFCTLEANTEVIYKVTNYYSPECDKGIIWNDPELNIDWPVKTSEAILSDKDKKQPTFSEVKDFF